MKKVLLPCPVCHILPIPKGHAHGHEDLANWHPAQPPFTPCCCSPINECLKCPTHSGPKAGRHDHQGYCEEHRPGCA